jgi:hypothetical protein
MTTRLLISLLAATTLFSTGCLFSRKSAQTKESPKVATEVEQEFRARWMAKRVADLAAQGVTGAAAQAQANQEFQEKFTFAVPSR